jgi:hypothetical protein
MIEKLHFLLALAAAPPVALLIGLALVTPITPSGALYLLGLALLAAGGLSWPWRRASRQPGLARARRLAAVAGLGLILLVALARIVLANNSSGLAMTTLPGGGSRWLNRLIDEQDVTLFALRPLQAAGLVTPAEMENIYPAFQEPYRAMRANEGVTPSPFLATYLGWQRPSAFDALFIYPDDDQSPLTAVVFLHGDCRLAAAPG